MNTLKFIVLLSVAVISLVVILVIENVYYLRNVSKKQEWFIPEYIPIENDTEEDFMIKTFFKATDITFGLDIMDDVFSDWDNFNAPVCEGGFRCRFARNAAEADAIIFQPSNSKEVRLSDYLKIRKANQRWIFFSWESAINSVLPPIWRHQFNWTATYMHSSDIYTPYGGGFRPVIDTDYLPPSGPSLKEKTKFAFASMSNCRAVERNRLISELRKYISVDLYGSCGTGRIPEGFWHHVELSKSYKFYLAFENSLCRDYITEKFWKTGVRSYSVPVILGGYERKDVERIAPPNSFIYVNDFKTTKDLANFLIELSKDENRYQRYLEWKNHYEVILTPHSKIALCNICRRLHIDSKPSIRDLDKEWNPSLCHSTSVRTKFDKGFHDTFGS